MKIRLTPELSYIIGFWRKRRTKEGLGVEGVQDALEIFSKEVLDKNLTTPGKLLSNGSKVYFYHTAYRKFFQEIEGEQIERYRYLNDYAASYLAGLFDSVGGIDDKGMVYLTRLNTQDEMMLIRLGFEVKRVEARVVVARPKAFLAFIKNYVKRYAGHPAFELATQKKRR